MELVYIYICGLPWWVSDKESAWNTEEAGDMDSTPGSGRSPGGRHGNSLQLRIPWRVEPGGLQSIGLQRVGLNRRYLAHTHAYIYVCMYEYLYIQNVFMYISS